MIRQKWLDAYWRWFLRAIDKRDFQQALKIAKVIELMR